VSINYQQQLKQYFGFDHFRAGQHEVVDKILTGKSALAVFPTGSGKSLCYQFSALNLPHLTLVVSPLLALMKDQLDFLAQHNIPAASIDSSLTPQQHQHVIEQINQGQIKILMVSIERFKNERFRQFVQGVKLSLLVVDEAHCISEWGHNFRPDYLKLPLYCQQLNIPQVLLLTATATVNVKKDMMEKFSINQQDVVQTGFYRNNLSLDIKPVVANEKEQVLAELVNQSTGAGIVYVTLQKTAEDIANYLKAQGINASAYHAGQNDDIRQKTQQQFMANNIRVVVATIAFGMGIDKSDIRFVVHFDLPKSIENYSQEIGRAGRDGLAANCTTLANLDGLHTLENFVYGDTPQKQAIEKLLKSLLAEQVNGKWETQISPLSLSCNIKQLPLKTLLVQMELLGAVTPLYSYFADFRIKLIKSEQEILSAFNSERQQFLSTIFAHTQFKKVWGTIDFPALLQALNGDRDRVIAALDYLAAQNAIVVESKKMTDVYQVNTSILNQPNLAENLANYCADKELKEIERLAALINFFQLPNCLSHYLAEYFDDPSSPINCQHCAVCHGQVAKLSYSSKPIWPDNNKLQQVIEEFHQHVSGKVEQQLTLRSYSHFLAGLAEPLFSRMKIRQLAGFGLCTEHRYQEIYQRVASLMGDKYH